MKTSLIALAACAGLAAATPAAAQYGAPVGSAPNRGEMQDSSTAPGSGKLNPQRDTAESMKSYAKILAYGECLIATGESAEGILMAKPTSRSERSKTGLLRQRVKTCSAKGVENIHSLVRGSLAEAMYRRQVRSAPVADAARAQAFVNAEKDFQSEREKGDQVMAGVMSCMVATSPGTAHAVLTSEHGSAAEAAAMDAFFAASQKCGAGASRPSNVSRSFIRAFVADSAWRFARSTAR